MAQRERKERITKVEFYNLGGFANSELFRRQSRGGAWRYYRSLDPHAGCVTGRVPVKMPEMQIARASGFDLASGPDMTAKVKLTEIHIGNMTEVVVMQGDKVLSVHHQSVAPTALPFDPMRYRK